MKLSSNIMCFHNELGLKKTIDIFADAGYDGIEFNTDIEEYHTDAHDEEFYKEIRSYTEEKALKFYQAHAPFPSSYEEQDKTDKRFDDIVKSFKHASLLGVETVVVHSCCHRDYKDGNREYMMQYNVDFYKKLIPYAEEAGIKIAIENIVYSITETSEGLLELLNRLDNHPVFTVCFDVGHGNIVGDASDMIRKIKNIGCTHFHDNDGVGDNHTLPYYGNIKWDEVMQAFADVGYTGNLNYEAGCFVINLPNKLRADAAKLMVKVGRQLIERFDYYKENK